MHEKLGKRLRLLRHALDMSAIEVAQEIGYSKSQLWYIENADSKANIEFIARICELYDVSIDLLVYGTDKDFNELLSDFYETTA